MFRAGDGNWIGNLPWAGFEVVKHIVDVPYFLIGIHHLPQLAAVVFTFLIYKLGSLDVRAI